MSSISQEVKQIALEIKKELENNPRVDNLEKFRTSLEALKMQSQVQLEASKSSILKTLDSYKDDFVKTQLMEIFNDKNMTGKQKLEKLQQIDDKVSREYLDNLNILLKQIDEDETV